MGGGKGDDEKLLRNRCPAFAVSGRQLYLSSSVMSDMSMVASDEPGDELMSLVLFIKPAYNIPGLMH